MIILKSSDEIEIMAQANRIVAEVLAMMTGIVRPGVTTDDLNEAAHQHIVNRGGVPTFIGYRGYPKALCTSVNEQVVHGIPSGQVLQAGDIVGVDCGVTYQGFVGDSAVTLPVGKISDEAQLLIDTTRECLMLGIEQVVEGRRIGDIGYAIQTHAEARGYSIVRDFVGHGIGRQMHEEPQVTNYGTPGTGPRIKNGMVFAIEPMLNCGTFEVQVLDDQWTVVTKDGRLSAHFEHSVACTPNGPRILSLLH